MPQMSFYLLDLSQAFFWENQLQEHLYCLETKEDEKMIILFKSSIV